MVVNWYKVKCFINIIVNMKKFHHYDWLREMQCLGNTVQKKGNLVQKRVTKVTFWLVNKQRNSLGCNQMPHRNGGKFGSGPLSSKNCNGWCLQHICFCNRNNCRGAEKLLLKRKHCENHWFLAPVWKNCLVDKEISIGNSMICSNIWHKYHEWYFEIIIRNFTSC